jgi:hypothetical protein
MKKIWLFIVLFSVSSPLIGQNKNQLNEIIISSINSYIERNNDFVKRGVSLTDTSSHYICIDGLPINFPFDSIYSATFFSLNNLNGLPKTFKSKLKKGIKNLAVDIKLSENQITVTITGRELKYTKKNNISVAVGDWGIYIYEYSCEKHEWVLEEVSYGGV